MKMTISMLLVASMIAPQLIGAERLSAKVDHDLPKKISEAALSAKEEGNHAASLRQLRQLLELYPNDGIIRAPIYAAMAEEAERAGDAAAAQQYKGIARELDPEAQKRAKDAIAAGSAKRAGNDDITSALLAGSLQTAAAMVQARQLTKMQRQLQVPPQGPYPYPGAPVGQAGYQPPVAGVPQQVMAGVPQGQMSQPGLPMMTPGQSPQPGQPAGGVDPFAQPGERQMAQGQAIQQGLYVPPGQQPMQPGQYVPPGLDPMQQGQYVPPGQQQVMQPGQYVPPGQQPIQQGQYVPPGQQQVMQPGQYVPPGQQPIQQGQYVPPGQQQVMQPGQYVPPGQQPMQQGQYVPPGQQQVMQPGQYVPPGQQPMQQGQYVPPGQPQVMQPGQYVPPGQQPMQQGQYVPPGQQQVMQPGQYQQPGQQSSPQTQYSQRGRLPQQYGFPQRNPYNASNYHPARMVRRGEDAKPMRIVHDHSHAGDDAYFEDGCGALLSVDGQDLIFTPSVASDSAMVIPIGEIVEIRMNTTAAKEIGAFHIATRKGMYLHLAVESGGRDEARAIVESLRKQLGISQ